MSWHSPIVLNCLSKEEAETKKKDTTRHPPNGQDDASVIRVTRGNTLRTSRSRLACSCVFDSTRQLEPLPLLPGAELILGRAWFKQHGLTDERLVSCIR